MANILDYVRWRGDLDFESSCFNEIDNLILSQLVYIDFAGIVSDNNKNVLTLNMTFKWCESLTGTLEINSNLEGDATHYYPCREVLQGAATKEGCDLVLTGTSTKLNELLATASATSNVRIED